MVSTFSRLGIIDRVWLPILLVVSWTGEQKNIFCLFRSAVHSIPFYPIPSYNLKYVLLSCSIVNYNLLIVMLSSSWILSHTVISRSFLLQVEAARSRYDHSARSVASLEEKRDGLLAEKERNSELLPELEQKKKVLSFTFKSLLPGFVCQTLYIGGLVYLTYGSTPSKCPKARIRKWFCRGHQSSIPVVFSVARSWQYF